MSLDGKAMAAEVLSTVRGFVARSIEPIGKRIEALEQATSPKDGKDGQDALPVDYKAIELMVSEAVSTIPAPKNGEPGKDADPEVIRSMVAAAVAEIPAAKDGKDGEPGKDAPAIDLQAVAAVVLPLVPIPKDGEPGKCITVDDVRPLIADEVARAAALIPKPKDGESVPIEAVQRMVDEAVGKAVAAIRVPKDGEPGRDAAHLEILPAIDETKGYPRGTYAKHANGVWRAFERTEGMRGWECLVAGVAAIDITLDHEREFSVKAVLSDGTVSAQVFKLPVSIYRGVFVEGRQYEQGDQVSWGAHQWNCNETTTEKPIEGGKAWTLSVKRGRDGKEGPPGPKWTPPAPVVLASGAR